MEWHGATINKAISDILNGGHKMNIEVFKSDLPKSTEFIAIENSDQSITLVIATKKGGSNGKTKIHKAR